MKQHREKITKEIEKYKDQQSNIIKAIQQSWGDKITQVNSYKKKYQSLESKINGLEFMLETTDATYKKYSEVKHELV